MRWIILAALALAATGLLGCSSGGRVGVQGRVTYAGEPLAVASITFIPTSEKGVKSGGLVENGTYKVEPKLGLGPGPHRVEIRWAKATGKKFKNEFGEELDARREGLPDKYHTNSTLTADLKPGQNVLDFDLEK